MQQMSIIQEWKKNFVAPLLKQHGFLMKQGEFIYKTDSVSRIIAVTPYRFNPENFIIEYGVHRSTIPLFSTLETIDRPKLYHCQIKTYVRDKKGHGMLFNAGKWIPKRQDELKFNFAERRRPDRRLVRSTKVHFHDFKR